MELRELVKKLAAKPGQCREVQFAVWEPESGSLVCAQMEGSHS